MKALIAATTESWTESISSLLTATGFTVARLRADAPAPEERELVIYSRPEYTVEAAIAASEKVGPALGEWVRGANLVLDRFRRNRSTVTVLHGPTLLTCPDVFRTWAKETLGVDVDPDSKALNAVTGSAVSRVIAVQCVFSSLDLRDLAGELEACAIPLGDEPPEYTVSWEEAYHELEQTGSEQGSGTKELEEENELLLLQLHQVQEELERYFLEARDLREYKKLRPYALELEKIINKLLHSRTWKVLAPVRQTGRAIKCVLRGRRVPRNSLPKRPSVLETERKVDG